MFAPHHSRAGQRSTALPDVLFPEDFDDRLSDVTVLDEADDVVVPPPPPPPPPTPEPPPIDLDALRADAAAQGRSAALQEVAAERDAAASRLLDTLAASLGDGAAEARGIAEHAADAVARLLVGMLAAALPAACARHGAREIAEVAARVLPALSQAPEVCIRVGPHGADAVADVVARLDPEMRDRVQIVHTDGMAVGDVRVAWQDGHVVRDTAAVLRDIADVLEPLGLLVTNMAEA